MIHHGLYHWRDGIFFARHENGDVDICKGPVEGPWPDPDSTLLEILLSIPVYEWVSIIGAMGFPVFSEDYRHELAKKLHERSG